MRLMVISTDSGSDGEQIRNKIQLLQTAVGPDVEINFDCQRKTRVCVDSNVDVVITGPEALLRAKKAQEDGYDAVCLYCGSDPGYDAMRELLDIPVVGAAHAAFAMAMTLGFQYSFITTSKRRIPQKKEYIRSLGIDISRLASVRAIEHDMSGDNNDPVSRQHTVETLAEVARICAEQDGADVVILGCLSFAGMAEEVSNLAGITVIDPAFAVVTLAEAIVRQGVSHSKRAYPTIPSANRSWSAGDLNT